MFSVKHFLTRFSRTLEGSQAGQVVLNVGVNHRLFSREYFELFPLYLNWSANVDDAAHSRRKQLLVGLPSGGVMPVRSIYRTVQRCLFGYHPAAMKFYLSRNILTAHLLLWISSVIFQI